MMERAGARGSVEPAIGDQAGQTEHAAERPMQLIGGAVPAVGGPASPSRAASASELAYGRPEHDHDGTRFSSSEHHRLGDEASRSADGTYLFVPLAPGYALSYGEITAMAGDYFDSIDEMRALAARPGKGAGTREEIDYVREVWVHGERHHKASEFSAAARNARDKKADALLRLNDSHFVNPTEAHRNLDVKTKTEDLRGHPAGSGGRLFWSQPTAARDASGGQHGPASGAHNAIAAYHLAHTQAVREAFEAGLDGRPIGPALAADAFASHFLTDAFAGGHVRLARDDLPAYWNPRMPQFGVNFAGYLVSHALVHLDLSAVVGGAVAAQLGPVLRKALEVGLRDLGMGYGDVLGNIMHNQDNIRGVKASIGSAHVTLKGDHHLGEGDELATAEYAVRTSIEDVREAWQLGRDRATNEAAEAALMTDGTFAAERLMPVVTPEAEQGDTKQLDWHMDPVQLMTKPVLRSAILGLFDEIEPVLLSRIPPLHGTTARVVEALRAVFATMRTNPNRAMVEILTWTDAG